ncbi:MAG: KamA family radical SAM protein [Candidatus Eisenbacteria sp.]|nr:KamA family radical SAM protein [Candidatus Eisenbacteria bacterium]
MDKSMFTADYMRSKAPIFFEVAKGARSLGSLRERLAGLAQQISFDTFHEREPSVGIRIMRIRDCAHILQSILSRRSDHLSGFSVAQAIRDISKHRARPDLSPAFYADLLHILLGIHGRGPGESPADQLLAPSSLTGRQAAVERSHQLDALGERMGKSLTEFETGLDADVIKARVGRKQKVLDVLGGSEEDWADWHWHIRHVIKDPDVLGKMISLGQAEEDAIREARARCVPFGITPHHASLLDEEPSGRDRSVRFQVIPPRDYVEGLSRLRAEDPSTLDFMREEDTSPVDLITRRYPSICILKPVNTCPQVCVYCQRNWEIEDAMDPRGIIPESQVDAAVDWIKAHPSITEVLVTGGDPLILSDKRLKHILDRLADIPSIERIRIGTRMLVTVPMRITDDLVEMLAGYHEPAWREVAIVTHFQHAYEVTPDAVAAVQKLRFKRIPVYNQLVYTFFVSRRFEACALRRVLRLAGVDPYYTFNMKGKDEMQAYRVPVARLMQEQKEEARLLPGISRTDEAVFNVPGQGKNYLRARQHRNMLSILPDGSRVYEFHPWEKNISQGVRSYVGRDVPILEYLERLENIGEDVSRYETIWYYF